MKIALLSPAGAMHRYNGSFSKNLHYAPITLALLAALVPQEWNADIKIYDETAGRIPLDLEADIIGMTCITGTSSRVYKYADYFRSKGITVMLGGPHPSLMLQEAKQHADCVIVGIGDKNFPQALLDYKNGKLKDFYYQSEDVSLDNRPLPRKDLINSSKYITMNTIEAVRGCSLPCTFCAYPAAFGKRLFKRPIEDVIAEIKTLKGKDVVFPDVNLIADYQYAKDLFTAMIPLKKWWFGLTTSAIALDDDLLNLFEKSGCKGLLIGFESVNQDSQKCINKGVNKVDGYKELMKKLHKRGIMVMGCFAFGADEDEKDVFEKTVKFAVEVKIDLPRYAIFTPFPGTQFYNELEKEGRIIESNWAVYDVEHCVFKPKNMTKEDLEAGIKWAWRETYNWWNIIKRIEWFNFKIMKTIWTILNFGYRKYALKFQLFGIDIMTDNSDIPDVKDEYQ